MKLDTAAKILDLEGNPAKDGEGDLTLGTACIVALTRCGVVSEGGQLRPAPYEVQERRFKLARRIKRGENIEHSEIGDIRTCIAIQFYAAGPGLVGAIGDELDRQVVSQAAVKE